MGEKEKIYDNDDDDIWYLKKEKMRGPEPEQEKENIDDENNWRLEKRSIFLQDAEKICV